mgnify:CR=1 FL=1
MNQKLQLDIPIDRLCSLIRKLPDEQEITDEYESQSSGRAWYRTQKEHILGWLSEYNGPGAYGRRNPSDSSRAFYNHFRCVAGLLWLAEALGEDVAVLRDAVAASDSAGPNLGSQCAAFRRVVPWSRIVELTEHHTSTHHARAPWTRWIRSLTTAHSRSYASVDVRACQDVCVRT